MPVALRVEPLEDRSTPAAGSVLVTLTNPALVLPKLAEAGTAENLGFGIFEVAPAPGYTPEQLAAAYAATPDVTAARPDAILASDQFSTDPQAATQWALNAINAPTAWDTTTGTGRTIVAIIDSGIDYTHPDLQSNLWVNPKEVGGNGIDDDGNGFTDDLFGADFLNNDGDPLDDNGHGTHIAGIIAAAGNNAIGTTGVLWKSRIMGLKFSPADGTGGFTSNAIRALNYAVQNGARIVNTSWGSTTADPAVLTAVERAKLQGVIVVASAGNGSTNNDTTPFFPASYSTQTDNLVAVAATDERNRPAPFSNTGASAVSIFAPGTNILSTKPDGGTTTLSGTSMAAPFVSGALALVWDQNPNWTYREVIDRVLDTAERLPELKGKSKSGLLDLAAALGTNTTSTAPPIATPAPTTTVRAGNVPLSLPDLGTATHWFTIAPGTTLGVLSLSLTIDHPRPADLVVSLTSPNGQTVTLSDRSTFASTTTWSSTDANTPLSAFNNSDAGGRWTLKLTDRVRGQAGRVLAASLSIAEFRPETSLLLGL
jgi:serine protease